MTTLVLSMVGSFIGTVAALLFVLGKIQELMWTDEDVTYDEIS